jgi:predicted nucleotidyltransferase component of viral defense system
MDRSNPFYGQVELLVRILPFIAKHKCFALTGGTAINLFVRELPRLSVDIDLVYIPLDAHEKALSAARTALEKIKNEIQTKLPNLRTHSTNSENTNSLKLLIRSGPHQVKVELSPVLRGTVWPVQDRVIKPRVEELFGFSEIQLVSFEDLYAGKICAGLDRQHPRDLFDLKLLLANEGVSRKLLQTFLVYLISHNRPIAELLSPTPRNITGEFKNEFKAMVDEAVTLEELLQTRDQLISLIRGSLTKEDREFLLSVKRKEPDWSLLGLEGIENLPAIEWKLLNLNRMKPQRHQEALKHLENILK